MVRLLAFAVLLTVLTVVAAEKWKDNYDPNYWDYLKKRIVSDDIEGLTGRRICLNTVDKVLDRLMLATEESDVRKAIVQMGINPEDVKGVFTEGARLTEIVEDADLKKTMRQRLRKLRRILNAVCDYIPRASIVNVP